MTKSNNRYWTINDKYWLTPKKAIEQLIYHPVKYRTFYYDYYRNIILPLKNGATLDDLKLSTKYWIWYLRWNLNPPMIPITFEEFLDNRSLSRYTQKTSKEVTYGNSNRNRNNSCKQ